MPKVLLFNIHDADKRMKIRVAALRAGLEAVEVGEADFARPIGSLFGLEGFAPAAEAESFSEEMLVMETLSSPLLDAMRASGAAVALKAVLTEQNSAWSAAALCRELKREHEAMRAYAPKKPVHQHKKRK